MFGPRTLDCFASSYSPPGRVNEQAAALGRRLPQYPNIQYQTELSESHEQSQLISTCDMCGRFKFKGRSSRQDLKRGASTKNGPESIANLVLQPAIASIRGLRSSEDGCPCLMRWGAVRWPAWKSRGICCASCGGAGTGEVEQGEGAWTSKNNTTATNIAGIPPVAAFLTFGLGSKGADSASPQARLQPSQASPFDCLLVATMSNHSIIRITRELSELQKTSDLSLAVACRDVDVRNVKAIIIGPPDTPYEFGFFEFQVKFGREYPAKAPSVQATTTNGGRCRFNPNIYAQGKVCFTWRGERGEEWSSAQGLESILISIQSLMSSNPYENEPGFETANDEGDKKNQKDYVAKIRHESLRITIIQRLEEYLGISPSGTVITPTLMSSDDSDDTDVDKDCTDESLLSYEPFRDLCKRRFFWYYDSYLLAINKAKTEVTDGQQFTRMPFECTGNGMDGKFNYTELERRLRLIKKTLDSETLRWAEEGISSKKKDTSVAANLQRQFEQVVESYKRNKTVTLDVELVDKNPFVWAITYFGRPMTNLDGGLFRIKLYFSPRFPDEHPRAKFETALFHHRIAADGTPCYTAKRSEDVKSHIESIIEALEEVSPPYDPRTMVNPEAAKLYWGSTDDKKLYNRNLRRSVQRSME
ncbi:hypothetical protein B7494_g5579 [Chlorociboria aeruginascens]|nr:hypothetical protein B7494_g5579 [Chlorociboria aeruginascens]